MNPTDQPQAEPAAPSPATLTLLDRDHSILAFNARVLDWATREDVPLLERLRYLTIVSSNLDEFFEVRFEPHIMAKRRSLEKGLPSPQGFDALVASTQDLVRRQYQLFNEVLTPAFEKHGIKILSHGQRNLAQRRWVQRYFEQEVQPLLVPVGLDPSHPFPQVANKSLNFIVRLGGQDAFGRRNDVAILKVPRSLPRFIPVPAKLSGKRRLFVSISSVIRAHLQALFPGRDVLEFSQFRVTRHSDLAVDEDDVRNLRTALRQGLQHRHFGAAVRLEVSFGCTHFLSDFLMNQFAMPLDAVYRVHGPVNLVRLGQLLGLVDMPALRFAPYQASYPQQLSEAGTIFERLKQGDVLIHQPYESFDGVLDFLREAVNDPQVLAIKQTIYRTGANSVLMDVLREGVRRGKEVTVVLELKARFDEEANINWAEMLESIGAQVLYGVVGLKTHAKMMLITRREDDKIVRYAHLSTGNYNPDTARLYTDLSHLTADKAITADVDHVFVHLSGQNRLPKLRRLLLAPLQLHRKLLEKIQILTEAAQAGQNARMILKMNALTDEPLIWALIEAGQAGVQVDLIVRGACMLPAQVPGQTDNIRVRSVVGRFLEHSRVFYFEVNGLQSLYLSSADWMNRNMMRRVELAWPITDPTLRERVLQECLLLYLQDQTNAWALQPDGSYVRVAGAMRKNAVNAQAVLMKTYGLKEAGKEATQGGVKSSAKSPAKSTLKPLAKNPPAQTSPGS